MHKALLFIKVVLLLATFVGTSSSHAKAGGHNLLALSTFDANINLGQQNTTEDDKAIITAPDSSLVILIAFPVIHSQSLVLTAGNNSGHHARAPPLKTLV